MCLSETSHQLRKSNNNFNSINFIKKNIFHKPSFPVD